MRLYVREFGSGAPFVMLHGLFGNGENWRSIARRFSDSFRILLPDLRNHGDSPHAPSLELEEMANDVVETADNLGVERFALLGHSLGGKVAMTVALRHPDRVQALVVVDIAPRAYKASHEAIVDGMQAVLNQSVTSRKEAYAVLAEYVPHASVRGFLLKSLTRAPTGEYRWKLNLKAIQSHYRSMIQWPIRKAVYSGPTLFVAGEQSGYVSPDRDADVIRDLFPNAVLEVIPKTGHWLHFEQPDELVRRLDVFFTRNI